MVAIKSIFAVLVGLAASVSAYPSLEKRGASLPAGVYFPPLSTDQRSPCPALNTLANHGHLRRNGANLTVAEISSAFLNVMNFGNDFTLRLLSAATLLESDPTSPFGVRDPTDEPGTVDLEDLLKHNRIEHDASLSRSDFPASQRSANLTLVADMVSRAADCKTFTLENAVRYRLDRIAESQALNPNQVFGPTQAFLAWGESALPMLALGGRNVESVPVRQLLEFFVLEKLPIGWSKPNETITNADVTALATKLRTMAATVDVTAPVPRCQSPFATLIKDLI
ncbi:hypothetical protein HDV05_007424 [Chytridiales sp. JEL 0842]|nr:hypothetical protein HDV05_007424 [Chytridiales sp. JEL 0842]